VRCPAFYRPVERGNVIAMDPSLDAWFKREILPHEGALLRYLYRVWPRRDDITDLRQETYARVFEAARLNRPLNPNAFLFATARNLMTDRLRRERVVSIEAVGDIEELNVLIDEMTPERRNIARQEFKRLAWAFDRLPAKCREVIWLRRVQELSQREVAQQLRITESAVEKNISRAVRLLNAALRVSDSTGTAHDAEDLGLEKNHETRQPD
jgi:RNA polymerase sigma factor (sigma-70 family)